MTSVLAVPALLTVFTGRRAVLSSQCVCVCVCEDAVLRCAPLLHHAMQVAHSCAPICYAIYAMLFAMPYALLYSMPLLVAAVAPHSCNCRRSYGRRL